MTPEHQERQREIYDARGDRYRAEALPTRDGFPSLMLTYREHVRLLNRLGVRQGDRVLDIGCSSGNVLHYLGKRFGARGTGMDISPVAIEVARERNPGFEFRVGSAEEPLPFQDGAFDFVVSFDVLEHLEKPRDALREICRVLKPGGKVLLHIPVTDIGGSMDWVARILNREKFEAALQAAGHRYEVMLTRKGYEDAARAAGFRILYSRRFNAVLQNLFDYHVIHRLLNRMFYVWKWPFGLYHRALAPMIQFAMLPDRVLQSMDVGASIYLIGEKQNRN